MASRVLPELDPRLSRTADRVLRGRGVEIGLGTSIVEATRGSVRLTTGPVVPARSLIWCVGVRPDPLVTDIGLATKQGRLVVDESYRHRNLGVRGGPRWRTGRREPAGDPAVRAAGQGGQPRLPPGRDARQPAADGVDWVLDAVLPRQCVQLGLVRSGAVPLDSDAPELPHIGT